jgi:hypothetical protein
MEPRNPETLWGALYSEPGLQRARYSALAEYSKTVKPQLAAAAYQPVEMRIHKANEKNYSNVAEEEIAKQFPTERSVEILKCIYDRKKNIFASIKDMVLPNIELSIL